MRCITPKKLSSKLILKRFDITNKFPFASQNFDGVLCTGTLHLFPEFILKKIFKEIHRVLKPEGKMIIDFATDIKRVRKDGKLYIRGKEPMYKLNSAKQMLTGLLDNFKVRFYKDRVLEDKVVAPQGFNYSFSCNFLIVVAKKRPSLSFA